MNTKYSILGISPPHLLQSKKEGSLEVADTMDRAALINYLNTGIQGEHDRIVQYLLFGWAYDDSVVRSTMESVARDEMRHLQWLAHRVVELGGQPSMKRGDGPPINTVEDLLHAEDEALDIYRNGLELVDAEGIRALFYRIMDDEERHKNAFRGLAQHVDAGNLRPLAIDEEGHPIPISEQHRQWAALLNEDLQGEYTAILQYLHQSFTAPRKDVSQELEAAAIDEMKHMGWLGEEVSELGAEPLVEAQPKLPGEMDSMLQLDIGDEQDAQSTYSAHASEIDNESLSALLERIRGHKVYHETRLKELLARLPKPKPEKNRKWTIGDLSRDSD